MRTDGHCDLHRPLANLELPTVEQLDEAIAATIIQRTKTPPELQHAQREEFADTLRVAMALTSPVALLRAIRLRTIVTYLTESKFDPSELLIHPFSQTIREAGELGQHCVREGQGRASPGTNREAPCRHIASPTTGRPNPTATSIDPNNPDRTPAQAGDEEELELNYEENDSAMEFSPASKPAIAANLANLTAESHQLRNPQRISIQLERHPSQPTPAGKGKTATTTKNKKQQHRGRSRSDGATRNRSGSKPRLSGTRSSDTGWITDNDAAHPSNSSHQ
eukprot:jgi/Tetstr1/456924/TSEL_043594.t1